MNNFYLLLISVLFCISLAEAKTVVPVLAKVKTATAVEQAVGQAQSPLAEPFAIKHSYPGRDVSTNVVALDMLTASYNICSGFRYHKYWIATAAHCVEMFGTQTNPRVVASVEQLSNGVWKVGLSKPNENMPANATVYFYRNGYSSDPSNTYGHAEDIAVIGLDKNDKLISLMQANIKKLDTVSAQMKDAVPATAKAKASNQASAADQAASMQAAARKKMTKVINYKKRFLQLPLDDYHFMTFSPESARLELAGRTVKRYWFEPMGEYPETGRHLPTIFPITYSHISTNDDHTVRWKNGEDRGGMSGTPLIINGFVVGLGSGSGVTALLTDEFTAFLKRHMGADYKQGLCLRSVANEEAITERAQQ